jgi:uncharacterized membrane protein YeaQ/YmgE (transglycosylase-associated protein family)
MRVSSASGLGVSHNAPMKLGRRAGRNGFHERSAKRGLEMSVLGWIILGLIAGFIASKIVNRSGQGFLLDIVLGIVGAVVGGFLFTALGATGITGFNLYSMFVAVVGAIVVLWGYHAIAGRESS